MQTGLMTDPDTTDGTEGKTRSAATISDAGDVMFDKKTYLNVMKILICYTLYVFIFFYRS